MANEATAAKPEEKEAILHFHCRQGALSVSPRQMKVKRGQVVVLKPDEGIDVEINFRRSPGPFESVEGTHWEESGRTIRMPERVRVIGIQAQTYSYHVTSRHCRNPPDDSSDPEIIILE